MEVNLTTEQTIPSGCVNGIVFDLMTNIDIEKLCNASIIEVSDVVSDKLGLPNASSQCATCGSRNIRDCDGHSGFLKLPKTIYHPFFVTEVVHILNQICPGCKSIKKDAKMKASLILEASEKTIGENIYFLEAFGKNLTSLQRKVLKMCRTKLLLPSRSFLARNTKVRFINLKKCLKIKESWKTKDGQLFCKYCARNIGGWYPSLKFKISSKDMLGRRSLSIVAEINDKLPKKFQGRSLSEVLPEDYWNFMPNVSLGQGTKPSKIDVTPHQAFCLLKELNPEFIQQFVSRRELLFLSYLPITPNCHRVMDSSHIFPDGPKISFDERTKVYKRLVDASSKIGEFRHHQQFGPLATSYTMGRVLDCWNVSKLRGVNSSNGGSSSTSGLRWLKDVVLSKRSDNAFRMTMVGDPKIGLHEVGIPADIARKLTVTEKINSYNLEKLNMVCNISLLAHMCHPFDKAKIFIRSKEELTSLQKTNQLKVGDVLYRPLENGDTILVNRPPSVHQHSLIGLSVRILPIESVVSINPLCCAPLLGDFDGDCLHGYIPQSVSCRVELQELVSLKHQLFNAQDGRSLVSLTHDSLTAAYLLTATKEFLTKFEMQQLAMLCPFPLLPLPVVKVPNFQTPLWTGEQLFGLLLPPTFDFVDSSKNIVIKKGEVMAYPDVSFGHRKIISSLFSSIFKSNGSKALNYIYCSQDLLCEYLSLRGFTVSLSDIYLTSDSYSRRKMIDEIYFGLEEAEDVCQVKQLLLNPEIQNLPYHYQDEDISCCLSQYKQASKRAFVSQISIAAFKDVFQELLGVVRQFVNKDNSMLAMIDAGSKGSLPKLIQQGACLGLQLSACPLPFEVPHKLTCFMWNNQKAQDSRLLDAAGSYCSQSFFAVVNTSFLDGLNPLESLVHAICGRSNLFSENAEVPGTLTRKLMYFMRDIYVAYDGTVRNRNGQQLVEFSYSMLEDSTDYGVIFDDYNDKNTDYSGLGGQPVGSLTACSISEAAYAALDLPINTLEDSPLLKLKNVLECSKSSASTVAFLFLSKRLEGWRYGFEYGALEVKNHLERVMFSDLIVTVLIHYDGLDVQGTNISPWTMHFHLSKDMLMRKRLNLQFIKNELRKCYDNRREKIDMMLPRLCFLSKNCSSVKQKDDDTCCITIAAETSQLRVQLETVRDRVIPLLLATHIKGFWASEKVEVLCESLPASGAELFLKVTMSKNLRGSFWIALQNACIPVMDLIDWKRSQPNNTYNVCSTYGIDAAWKYFVKSLKSVTADIGRDILKRHLIMTADCLSATGEFHGLSTKGLRQQRDDMSISSPFTQACLSHPANCFINAAKLGSVDRLSGTLDAVAWGKEAPVGTGGPFQIIYAGKVPKLNSSESMYKHLLNLKAQLPLGDNKIYTAANQSVPAKWKKQPKYFSKIDDFEEPIDPLTFDENYPDRRFPIVGPNNKYKLGSKWNSVNHFDKCKQAFGFISKSLKSASSWTDVVDMGNSLRMILYKYPMEGFLDEEDKSSLMEALNYHPRKASKIGSGIQEIKVGHNAQHPGSRCFVLLRIDGTVEDFSYRKCVTEAAKLTSPEFGSVVNKMLNQR